MNTENHLGFPLQPGVAPDESFDEPVTQEEDVAELPDEKPEDKPKPKRTKKAHKDEE